MNSNNDQGNITVAGFRPPRATVADIAELLMDQAQVAVTCARRLTGRGGGVPVWEEMMDAWKNRRPSPYNRTLEEKATSHRLPQPKPSTGVNTVEDRTAEQWMKMSNAEVLGHPLLRLAMNRGLVRVVQPQSWDKDQIQPRVQSGEQRQWQTQTQSLTRTQSQPQSRDKDQIQPRAQSGEQRQWQGQTQGLTRVQFQPRIQVQIAPRQVEKGRVDGTVPRQRQVRTMAERKAVSVPETAICEEVESEDNEEFLQVAIGDAGLPDPKAMLSGSDSEGF